VKDYSEETARRIDQEILKIVHDSYKRAKSVVQEDIDCLHNIAEALLEKESLDAANIEQIMGNCRKDTQIQMTAA
ncbi:MAG: cell division protein FtsH, partial [Thermodesulfobacteriota bacterium]|nr:cell division protein FtsH [Thermodesulfobacteriota bacterium]